MNADQIDRDTAARARDLYQLQAFLKDRPELHDKACWSGTTVYLSFQDHEANDFKTAVRSLKRGAPIGAIRKNSTEQYMFVTWQSKNSYYRVELSIGRAATCTSRVVGTKNIEVVDPAAPMVTKTVDVLAWDCDPVLADVDG